MRNRTLIIIFTIVLAISISLCILKSIKIERIGHQEITEIQVVSRSFLLYLPDKIPISSVSNHSTLGTASIISAATSLVNPLDMWIAQSLGMALMGIGNINIVNFPWFLTALAIVAGQIKQLAKS